MDPVGLPGSGRSKVESGSTWSIEICVITQSTFVQSFTISLPKTTRSPSRLCLDVSLKRANSQVLGCSIELFFYKLNVRRGNGRSSNFSIRLCTRVPRTSPARNFFQAGGILCRLPGIFTGRERRNFDVSSTLQFLLLETPKPMGLPSLRTI